MKKSTGKVIYLKLGVIAAVAAIAVLGFANFSNENKVRASAFGPLPSHTGAPGESSCVACHMGEPVNSGGGAVIISGLPTNYRPNQQYPVTVTVNHFNAGAYGFQMTAVDKEGVTPGTFQLPAQTPAQLQVLEDNVGGDARTYVEHTENGLNSATPNTKSWSFNWTAPATRVGKIGFYAGGNGANGNGNLTGDFIYTSDTATFSGTPTSSFDGDGRSDLAVFRPSSGVWYSTNTTDGAFRANVFGASGDKVVPGDYDGDGKGDYAIFRPSNGVWFILKSSDGGLAGNTFGAPGDIAAPGDYDGDGISDLVVYRPSNGAWYIYSMGTGQIQITSFGLAEDKPIPGDYDADGKTDIAVFRPSAGNWYILQSSNGALSAFTFGASGDRPVQGDYDGDGKTDAAIFRASSGVWYILKSGGGLGGNSFGISTDTPVPGDYDGDGKTDIAVFRDGAWFVLYSDDNAVEVFFFGSAGDIPAATGYIAQ